MIVRYISAYPISLSKKKQQINQNMGLQFHLLFVKITQSLKKKKIRI